MNPFDLPGPQFLWFFAILATFAIGLIVAMRFVVAANADGSGPEPTLDPYEAAHLAGGPGRVALLAVATLADRGHIKLDRSTLMYVRTHLGPDAHPIERTLLAARPASTRRARAALAGPCETIEAALHAERLTVGVESARLCKVVAIACGLLVGLIGVAKIGVGLSRGRPVEFLVLLTLASTIALFVMAFARPPRTARGRRVLQTLQAARPKSGVGTTSRPLSEPSAAMAVALWGLPALAAYPAYADLRSGFGGSDGSGASGSSCSSGDGGGCGGGGCGGCGGGD